MDRDYGVEVIESGREPEPGLKKELGTRTGKREERGQVRDSLQGERGRPKVGLVEVGMVRVSASRMHQS